MSIQLQLQELPGYVVANFIGDGAPEEIWQNFDRIAERCDRAGNKKVLIDSTGINGELSFIDKYFLGENAQIFARHGLKIATVLRSELIDSQKFGETVARNRGVNVRVFADVPSAKSWLFE